MNRRAVVMLAPLALLLSAWRFHPIHAARLELAVTAAGHVDVTLHVYRDDFPPGSRLADVAVYLDHALVLTDHRAARVALRTVAMEPEGDRLRISLIGDAPGGVGGGHIGVTILQDRFADQVDVVDARLPNRRSQLVFLKGDAPQALP